MTSRIAFIDTETISLDPDIHSIWEVAWIDGKSGAERRWFLPVDLGLADPIALRIGGFYERHPNGNSVQTSSVPVSSPGDFAEEFEMYTRGAHLVGANVSFDEERLRKLLRANGACPDWHYHKIDTEALVMGYLAAQGIKIELPYKSEDLWKHLGLNPDDYEKHTAIGDARLVKDVYWKVMST